MNIEPLKSILEISNDKKETLMYFLPLDTKRKIVKCDLEGSEWHLLTNYPDILSQSKFLLMEWHSWHHGGGGIAQIEKKLNDLGFNILRSSPTAKALGREGEVGLFLAQNLNFEN